MKRFLIAGLFGIVLSSTGCSWALFETTRTTQSEPTETEEIRALRKARKKGAISESEFRNLKRKFKGDDDPSNWFDEQKKEVY